MPRFQTLLILCAFAFPLSAVEIQRLSPGHSPRPGDLVEWELAQPPAEWMQADPRHAPFLRITESDGTVFERPAFLFQAHRVDPSHRQGEYKALGEVSLRIRHSPRQAGSLRWDLFAPRADPETATPLASDTLSIAPGRRAAGAIAQAPYNHRLLAYPDGRPFIPIGPNVAWALGRDRLATFITYLDALAEVGGNHVRVWCASWFGQIEGSQPQQWRLDQAWLLDQVFTAAAQRGIAITLVLDNHHDFQVGDNFPYGSSISERGNNFFSDNLAPGYRARIHYLIARYAAFDNLKAWELFNEIDLTGLERWRLVNWARSASDFLAGADPYMRLRTISWAGDDWPQMRELPRINLYHIHRYVPHTDHLGPGDDDIIAVMAGDVTPLMDARRPFLFAEVGHHGNTAEDVPGNALDQEGLILVHMAWAGFLLGGAGPGMNWWWDSWIHEGGLWHLYKPMRQAIDRIDWRDSGLRPMSVPLDADLRVIGWQSPHQALVWPQTVQDNWFKALIRQSDNPFAGRRFGLTLNGMETGRRYSVTALDMFDGSLRMSSEAESDENGRLRLALPAHDGRQVLVITAISHP
ncbi:MAG: hypothetical protein EA402_13120 [Planctomycetota bacterium]|nr:MAG: hypothetical protein EA402_13120 [Planctomycetota bacterium]